MSAAEGGQQFEMKGDRYSFTECLGSPDCSSNQRSGHFKTGHYAEIEKNLRGLCLHALKQSFFLIRVS